jgi:hypothetical protein
MEKLLGQLVEKLQAAHAKHLRSILLYGSGATGEVHERFSDLNVLCTLDEINPEQLSAAEPVFKWWRARGNPAPLLLAWDEVQASADCFPIEYHDIAERRRVLFGDDPFSGLRIDDRHYRSQVEHDLRAKFLRLRQKAAGVLNEKDLLLRLMADSVSTFCVLARHALRLAGAEAPHSKHAIVASMKQHFGIDARSFDMLLILREGGKRPRDVDPAALFRNYLAEIGELVAAVDRMEN